MSQRDDELLTLVRAELARRDTTTPREGFDMRVHQAVRDLQRPRGHGHRLFGVGLAAATVAAVAVALAVGLRAHQNGGSVPAGPVPTPSHAAAGQGLMVFQAKLSDTRYRTTLVDGSGKVIRTLDAPGQSYGDVLGGRALYLDDGHQGWVLHRDGSITGVSPAARPDLAAAGRDVMMVGDHTAVAPVPVNQEQLTSRFEVIDVLTGARRVVFDAEVAPGAEPSSASEVGIIGSSRDMGTLYVLVRDMVIDGRLQRDPVVDDVDVATAKVTRTRPLPVGTSPVAMSPDGRLVAWQEAASDTHTDYLHFVTHVTDLASGHTVDAAGTGVGVGGVFGPGMLFSPDGARLMVAGHDNLATPTGIETIVEVSTADGRLLQHQQPEFKDGEQIEPVGWLDAGHLAYDTVTNTSQGGRLVGVEADYVIDLSGPTRRVTEGNLGSLVAVLS